MLFVIAACVHCAGAVDGVTRYLYVLLLLFDSNGMFFVVCHVNMYVQSPLVCCGVVRLTGCERIPACLPEKRTEKEGKKEGEVKMAAQLGLLPGRPREKYKE